MSTFTDAVGRGIGMLQFLKPKSVLLPLLPIFTMQSKKDITINNDIIVNDTVSTFSIFFNFHKKRKFQWEITSWHDVRLLHDSNLFGCWKLRYGLHYSVGQTSYFGSSWWMKASLSGSDVMKSFIFVSNTKVHPDCISVDKRLMKALTILVAQWCYHQGGVPAGCISNMHHNAHPWHNPKKIRFFWNKKYEKNEIMGNVNGVDLVKARGICRVWCAKPASVPCMALPSHASQCI